jgi:hypothetical protein
VSDGDFRRPPASHEDPRDGGEREEPSPADDPGERDPPSPPPLSPSPPPPDRPAAAAVGTSDNTPIAPAHSGFGMHMPLVGWSGGILFVASLVGRTI